MATKKDVMRQFAVESHNVIQIDSKQLFVVYLPTRKVLVSYRTIVGESIDGVWHLTQYKYSCTTSKQLSQFARGKTVIYVAEEIKQ